MCRNALKNIKESKRSAASKGASVQSYSEDCRNCQACNSSCSKFDLCQKRVCIVGGVERMEVQYRSMIEENNGFLDYHSGSMQGRLKVLKTQLQRADIILCPINCNSHTACLQVKSIAKKLGKKFHMLPTGSLTAVKKILEQSVGYA